MKCVDCEGDNCERCFGLGYLIAREDDQGWLGISLATIGFLLSLLFLSVILQR